MDDSGVRGTNVVRIGTDVTRRAWAVGHVASLMVLAVLLAIPAEPILAQEGMNIAVGPVLARRVDRGGGPSLGRVGVEAQLFKSGQGRHAWGVAFGYHPLGRFPNPVPGDYFDESVVGLGPRIRWSVDPAQRAFVTLGIDALAVKNDNPPTSGHDPAIGGFAGFGYHLAPPTSAARLLLEVGIHALAATGELTAGSGFFGTLLLGIAF